MKNEFDEISKEVADEFGDFDACPATYQVWMLGYDAADNITDFEVLVKEFLDPDDAVKFAQKFANDEEFEIDTIPDSVKTLEVLVETVVDYDGFESNEQTLYSAMIKFEK